MPDRPPHSYEDQDTSDAYLDRPVPTYQPDGKPISGEEIDDLLAKAASGEAKLPEWPAPVDH